MTNDDFPCRPVQMQGSTRAGVRGGTSGWFAFALTVLSLCAVGSYGVIHLRAASQDEIHSLRAVLATAPSTVEVDTTKKDLQKLELQNEKTHANIEVLNLYNERLAERVAELQEQLAVQQVEASGVSDSLRATTDESAVNIAAKYVETESLPH